VHGSGGLRPGIDASSNRALYEVLDVDIVVSARRDDHPQYTDALAPINADHFEVFEELCLSNDAGGDLAADAYLAAIGVEQGATVVSLDRDLAGFSRLRWSMPATA